MECQIFAWACYTSIYQPVKGCELVWLPHICKLKQMLSRGSVNHKQSSCFLLKDSARLEHTGLRVCRLRFLSVTIRETQWTAESLEFLWAQNPFGIIYPWNSHRLKKHASAIWTQASQSIRPSFTLSLLGACFEDHALFPLSLLFLSFDNVFGVGLRSFPSVSCDFKLHCSYTMSLLSSRFRFHVIFINI